MNMLTGMLSRIREGQMAKRTTRRRLTKAFIDTLAPARGKARVTIFDTVETGLCVRATNKGHISFYVMARSPTGRQVWAEIKDDENVPVTTLTQARELAPTGRDRIKRGKVAYPKTSMTGVVTYAMAVAAYIDGPAKLTQRSWKETERILNAVPWGEIPLENITSADAQQHIASLVAAGTPAKAKVTLGWLTTMFRWAWRQTLVDQPIMDRLRANDFGIAIKPRTRVYTDAELKALWNATGALTDQQRRFVKLLALLGVRKGALGGMRRCELGVPDDKGRPTQWVIPTARVKTTKRREVDGRVYIIPLSRLARRVLMPLLAGDADLLFPSPTRPNTIANVGSPLQNKVRKASGVTDWYSHAHRHTIASWLQDEGHDEFDRALVLNHSAGGSVTSHYSHGYGLERARSLLDKWADHVAGVVAAKGVELIA